MKLGYLPLPLHRLRKVGRRFGQVGRRLRIIHAPRTPLINDRLKIFLRGNNRFLTKSRFQNVLPGGFEPVTPRSIVQRGTTEPTTAAAEPDSNLCYLCNNLDYAAVNFFHNHPPPPRASPGICIKILPPLGRFCILSFARGQGGNLLR